MRRRIYPWQTLPAGPCGCGPVGSLHPYRDDGAHYGPRESTLFCLACGHGWCGSDAEIEQALVAEIWLDAWERSGKSEVAFMRSQRRRDTRAEKRARWQRRNNHELFEVNHG